MNRELFPLIIMAGAAIVIAAVVGVLIPSQRPRIPWPALWQQEKLPRRIANYALYSLVLVSFFFWPPSQTAFRSLLDGTLSDALADPPNALRGFSLIITIACVMMIPLCDDRFIGPRSKTPPWPTTGRVFSHGRHKRLIGIVMGLGSAFTIGLLLFQPLIIGMSTALILYLLLVSSFSSTWVEADDVGVNWAGYRFRWEEVASWRVVFSPGSGLDDGSNDSYRLSVFLANGDALSREDIHPHQLEKLFSARVPDKRINVAADSPV